MDDFREGSLTDAGEASLPTLITEDTTRVPSTPTLRRRLQEARTAAGLNRVELTRLAGVSSDFVRVSEMRPQRTLDRAQLVRVMAVLQMTDFPQDEKTTVDLLWDSPCQRFIPSPKIRALFLCSRRATGKSRNDVAATAGISQGTVRNIEMTSKSVNALHVTALASAIPVLPRSPLGKKLLRQGFTWIGDVGGPPKAKPIIDWNTVPLGTTHDTTLAVRLGVRTKEVWRARKRRGIPAYKGPKQSSAPADKHRLDLLEVEILKQLGLPPRDESGAIDWTRVPFGQVPDALLGRWLGVSNHMMGNRRERFRIGPCPYQGLINWALLPIGKIPDTHVAAMTGLAVASVVRARKVRGVRPAPLESRSCVLPPLLPPSSFVIRVQPVSHVLPSPKKRIGRKAAGRERARE